MKKLVLGSLITVLVSQATGCIITTGEEEEDALISATWLIANRSSAQVGLPCPPTITTAAVYSQAVDADNQPIGSPIIDLFDCDDNAGTTAPLPPDAYQVWVELTSEGGGTKYAKSVTYPNGFTHFDGIERKDIIDVTLRDGVFNAPTIFADSGYFELDWRLVDSITRAPLTCAEGAVDGVAVLSTNIASPSMFTDDQFNCEEGFEITGALLAGDYTITIDAINPQGAGLGPPEVINSRTIQNANRITDLGSIDVRVD